MVASEWHKIHENTYIIYTLIGIAIIILLFSMTLHFYQHFKCQSCLAPIPETKVIIPRQRSDSILESAINSKRFQCICAASDGENFDFFPMAFVIYLIYVIFLCLLLILKLAIIHINTNDTFNYYKYPTLNNIISINGLDYIHKFTNYPNIYALLTTIIDTTLIYLIMLMSIIESLFTFYRFYTTLMTIKHLLLITIKDVLKRFIFYVILFVILYGITINLYFWIFPFVLLIHSIFNIYCNLRFASILITSYTNMMSMYRRPSVGAFDNANKEVLEAAYFMRKVSVICTIIQTIYLLLFMIIYYININLIIIYLPILWCISSFMFSLNFARNRLFVQLPFTKLSQKCKECKKRNYCCIDKLPNIDVINSASTIEIPNAIGDTKMDNFVMVEEPLPDTKDTANTSTDVSHQRSNISKTKSKQKRVSFAIQPEDKKDKTEPKHVSFDIKASNKPQYDLRITAPQAQNDDLILNNTPSPNDDDTPFSKSLSNKNTPRNTDMQPVTPSKSNTKTEKVSFQAMDSNDKKVSWNDYGSNSIQMGTSSALSRQNSDRSRTKHYTGASVEYTLHSAFELSVHSEYDVDGKKQEEFNRYLSGNNKNEDSVLPTDGPTVPHFTSLYTEQTKQNTNINAMGVIEENKEEQNGVTHRLSKHEHKLDIEQLTLQLTLLKKFGFDVRDIKKSFSGSY